MNFEVADEQRAVLEAVDALLARHAGPERASELAAKGGYDFALDAALAEAGFAEIALADGAGPLDAALVAERVAAQAGSVAYALGALAAPLALGRALAGPVAFALASDAGPVRFAPAARTLVVIDGERAREVALAPGDVAEVASNFGYPLGRVGAAARARGADLGAGSGARGLAAWRAALAVEAVGLMDGALRCTLAYLTEREQFGRAIGSFQAVQHRLADCAVLLEGARWLARETVANGAGGAAAATAAGFAAETAARVHRETHQLSGAIGYTTEHALHAWSMRLQALRLELGGAGAHYRAVAQERWGSPA